MFYKLIVAAIIVAEMGWVWVSGAEKCNGIEGLCDLPYNLVTFPGTHNSGAGASGIMTHAALLPANSCWYRYQMLSITEQLKGGVRYFDVGPCYVKKTSFLRSKGTWICTGLQIRAYGMSVEKFLEEIDTFLSQSENQREIVTIHFNENMRAEEANDIYEDLVWRLQSYWLPNRKYHLGLNTVFGETHKWPELREAVATNQRIFVIMPELIMNNVKADFPPWIIPGRMLHFTVTREDISGFNCHLITKASNITCRQYDDTQFIVVTAYADKHMCNSDRAQMCSDYTKEAVAACQKWRLAWKAAANAVIIDYLEDNTVGDLLKACRKANEASMASWEKGILRLAS